MGVTRKVKIIGSGFAGLSAAAHLAKQGYEVDVFEKNEGPGGRASFFQAQGFSFDMGPSWYWMPDVFEHFFNQFGTSVAEQYNLVRLDPGYRIYFGEGEVTDIPADYDQLKALFESFEPGSASAFDRFMREAGYKYQKGIQDLVYRPSRSLTEFADFSLLKDLFKLQLFSSMRKHVHSMFKDDRIRKILEFPVYFLGALPQDTPALYSLMNYADLKLGTWYPMGGMYEIVKGMERVAKMQGARFHYNSPVDSIVAERQQVRGLKINDELVDTDLVVAGADYHHVDQHLLEPEYRNYNSKYWDKRVMAPSSLIFYLGVNKKLKGLQHHNLFFDKSFETFGKEIYDQPQWPTEPLFYVCCPSQTDDSVAPEGHENLFVLIPVAPGLEDREDRRKELFDLVIERLEKLTGQEIKDHVVYNRSFAHRDFIGRYNAFKGNAYGLANTLFQTAIFKPSLANKHLKNLFYTGQLTVPGPGVPPSIISGEVVSKEIQKEFPLNSIRKNDKTRIYERAV